MFCFLPYGRLVWSYLQKIKVLLYECIHLRLLAVLVLHVRLILVA